MAEPAGMALLSGFGKKAADNFADLLLSPALAFWLGGLAAWTFAHSWRELGATWQSAVGKNPGAQVLAAVAALLVVAGSARMVDRLALPALRLLEGYWPAWADGLAARGTARRGRAIARRDARWRELYLDGRRSREFRRLNAARAAVPPDPADRMPTALGDLLRAAEARPRHRYGLDAVVCFPRLWLVLPDNARADLAEARRQLDDAARLWVWSLLFLLWTPLAWWAAVVAALGMPVAYRFARIAAGTFGDLLLACVDLYRGDLYEKLGFPRPEGAAADRRTGAAVTALLERGFREGA